MQLMINRFAELFEVFRVPFFFAVAEDEDGADGGEQEREDKKDNAHQQTAERDVFRVGLEARAVKRADGNDDKNDS